MHHLPCAAIGVVSDGSTIDPPKLATRARQNDLNFQARRKTPAKKLVKKAARKQ